MTAPPIPMRSDEQFVEELREREARRKRVAAWRWFERLCLGEHATERGPLRDCGDDTCTACAPKGAK